MQIEWITVAAQIVNFLVLVWLLKRFLYGPIMRAMARREERIAQRLDDAATREREARQKAERLQAEREDLEARRGDILDDARAEADDLRARLRDEARHAVEEERAGWHARVAQERDDWLEDLRAGAAHEVHALARSVLADLVDASLQDRVVARFAEEIETQGHDRRARLREAVAEAGGAVTVESAFDLSEAQREAVMQALASALENGAPSADPARDPERTPPDSATRDAGGREEPEAARGLQIDFAVDDALLLGIRLHAGARTVEWSLAAWLDQFETAVAERLDEAEGTAPRRDAA
jgi:F-type H+-transporting ATPase subunit b